MADKKIQLKDDASNSLFPITKAANVTGLATVATTGNYNDLTNKPSHPYLRNDQNGTLVGNTGDTPLALQSQSTSTYIGFKNSGGTMLGYLGVNGSNKPVFYGSSEKELALKSDNTWRNIQVNGTQILGTGTDTDALNLKAGSNVTLSNSGGTVTIAASGGSSTDTWRAVKVKGTQYMGTGTSTSALNFVQDTSQNITLTGNSNGNIEFGLSTDIKCSHASLESTASDGIKFSTNSTSNHSIGIIPANTSVSDYGYIYFDLGNGTDPLDQNVIYTDYDYGSRFVMKSEGNVALSSRNGWAYVESQGSISIHAGENDSSGSSTWSTPKNINLTVYGSNAVSNSIKLSTLNGSNICGCVDMTSTSKILGPSEYYCKAASTNERQGYYFTNTNYTGIFYNHGSSGTNRSVGIMVDNGSELLVNYETVDYGDISLTYHNGDVAANTFHANSDRRLKENIVEYKPEKSILDLPVYKFDYINGDKNQIGCMAQDLQEICPEIVKEKEDGYLSIQESKLVYLLLDEVKQLKSKVEDLESKLGGK